MNILINGRIYTPGRRMSRLASSPSIRSAPTRRTTSMRFSPGGGVLDPGLNNNVQHHGEQVVVTLRGTPCSVVNCFLKERPWRTRHGGARGRRRRGNPPFGRVEKTTKRAEPNFAPTQLVVLSGRK